MHFTISRTIPAGHHLAWRELVHVGFEGVAHHDVEVHVRSRPPQVRWTVHYRIPSISSPQIYAAAGWAPTPG